MWLLRPKLLYEQGRGESGQMGATSPYWAIEIARKTFCKKPAGYLRKK